MSINKVQSVNKVQSISSIIQQRLILLRKTYGLSIGEIARSLNIDPSTWHHIESGKRSPSVGLLDKIQAAYGINITLELAEKHE